MVSTYVILQRAFGINGAKVVTGIIALTLFGWFGISTGLFAASAQALFSPFGVEASTQLWAIIGGVLMTSTAVIGFRALDKLSLFAVPLLLLLLGVALYNAFLETSIVELFRLGAPENGMPLGVAISIIAGAFMVGAIITPDLTRYARSQRHAMWAAIIGFLVGFPTILFLTSVLAAATNEVALVPVFATLGLGAFAFMTLVFASWTTNDNNLYSASLGLATIFEKVEKWKLAAVAGIVGTILAVLGILNFFVPWLLLLGILIPPIGGIYVINHFFSEDTGPPKDFYWIAFAAWIGASVFAYATTAAASGGLGMFSFTTIPAVDSILVSAALYFVLQKIK